MSASVNEIIDLVKLRVGIPASQDRFTTVDFTRIINEQISDDVYPWTLALTEEFYIVREVVPLLAQDGAVLFPNSYIPIPKRAYGRTLRELKYLDNGGNVYNIPQINLEDAETYNGSRSSNTMPSGFYLISDGVQLLQTQCTQPGAIIFHYLLTHPTVTTSTTQYLPITRMGYDDPRASINLTTLPIANYADMSIYSPPSSVKFYDFFRKDTGAIVAANVPMLRNFATDSFSTLPGHFTINDAQQINSFQAGGFSAANDILMPFSEDLYLLPSGLSQFTCLPPEVDKILVSSVSGRILEALGHYDELAANKEVLKSIKTQMTNSLGQRVKGEPIKAVSRKSLYSFSRMRNGW